MESLYIEYKAEQRKYKLFVPILRYFGFLMLGLYLYLLFSVKGLDPKYFLLNIYAMYCNVSVMILFQYYKVPRLFENLFSKDKSLVFESYRIIHDNRSDVYKSFLIELFGRNFTEEQLQYGLEEIKYLILSQDRLEWRKIGKLYFAVFFVISILLFYFLFPIETVN
ncbi:MAG: hypothetical protein KBA66_10565 [Leptospiraceae bacterium]|nr:hypothetical protein [Leptospiraceae bacterium]